MQARRRNPRLAKRHRTYSVEDVAGLYGVHKNTVRNWIKQGLPTIDRQRPILILGCDLVDFLQERRKRNKRPCGPGQIYCVRCRAPKTPAGEMVEYEPVTETLGNLIGICPACETIMHRRVSRAKLDEIRGQFEITMPQAAERIGGISRPSVNCDFEEEPQP